MKIRYYWLFYFGIALIEKYLIPSYPIRFGVAVAASFSCVIVWGVEGNRFEELVKKTSEYNEYKRNKYKFIFSRCSPSNNTEILAGIERVKNCLYSVFFWWLLVVLPAFGIV